MIDVLEILSALVILTAFAAAQGGWMSPHSRRYLVLNLVGSATLAGIAVHDRSWGFLLLEGVWAIVSLFGLIAVERSRRAAGPYGLTSRPARRGKESNGGQRA